MITDPQILSGKICPYCGEVTIHCNDAIIYGRTYGTMIYVCLKCDAYVGCHKPHPKQALGRLANAELRAAKISAHAAFDSLWKRKISQGNKRQIARNLAYKWLSKQMGIERDYCHIGMFDVAECNQVIEICKPFLR